MVNDTLNLPFAREFCTSVLLAERTSVVDIDPSEANNLHLYANGLKAVADAESELEAAESNNARDTSALKRNVESAKRALKPLQDALLTPRSTAATCLMYVNSSTLRDFIRTETNSYIARSSLVRSQMALITMQAKAAIYADPRTSAEEKKVLIGEMEKIYESNAETGGQALRDDPPAFR